MISRKMRGALGLFCLNGGKLFFQKRRSGWLAHLASCGAAPAPPLL